MGRAWCMLVTSKPEGIGLLLWLCDGLFAHGEGGAATFVGADMAGGKRGKGSMEKWTIELKYPKAYTTRRDMPLPLSHSLLLLRILVQAHISRIRLSLLTIFTSAPHTRFIPLARIPLPSKSPIFSLHIFLRCRRYILPVISPGHVTNFRWTSFTHHFRRFHPSRR